MIQKVGWDVVFRTVGYDARLFLLSLLSMPTICSCGICKPEVVYRDSVRVEYRERVVHDTATFFIEKEVEKVVTRDTSSHLENAYARSDASVSGGFLSHSLESIPQVIRVPYEVPVHDTLIVEKHAEETIREVEKELTWWQRFRMGAFPWLLSAILLCLVWIFRKSIFKSK